MHLVIYRESSLNADQPPHYVAAFSRLTVLMSTAYFWRWPLGCRRRHGAGQLGALEGGQLRFAPELDALNSPFAHVVSSISSLKLLAAMRP